MQVSTKSKSARLQLTSESTPPQRVGNDFWGGLLTGGGSLEEAFGLTA